MSDVDYIQGPDGKMMGSHGGGPGGNGNFGGGGGKGGETTYPSQPKGLESHHVEAIKAFTSSSYSHIRMMDHPGHMTEEDIHDTFLHAAGERNLGKAKGDPSRVKAAQLREEATRHAAALHDAILRHGVHMDGPVYRGISGLTKEDHDAIVGHRGEVSMRSLSSTSTSHDAAKRFATPSANSHAIMYEIHGAKGLPMMEHSAYQHEKEILIGKSERYRVAHVGSTDSPNVTHVVLHRVD